MVVDRNFKPRSVLCDTALVKALCSVSSDQHMKKLLSLREGPYVMMQICMQQNFADRCQLHEHPGGHASWTEPTMRKLSKESTWCSVRGLVCRWNIQKMQSESTEYVRKTTGFFTNSWRIKISFGKLRCRARETSLGKNLDES